MHGRGSMIPRSNANAPLQQSRALAVSAQSSHSKYLNASRESNLSHGQAPRHRYRDDQDMLGGSVDDGASGGQPLKSLLAAAVSSPHARNHQLPQDVARFQLPFKQQMAGQGNPARKSPNNLFSQPFQISRQQQGQQRANRPTENTRYVAKASDVTADHQNQIKSIEQQASKEIAGRPNKSRYAGEEGREVLSHSRSENQRQARTAMGQFQKLTGFDQGGSQVQTLPWAQHQCSVIGQGQQRRTQAAAAAVQYPRILESNQNSRKEPLMCKDDLVTFSHNSSKQEHAPGKGTQSNQQSYYVQMLKTSQGNKLNNRQPAERPLGLTSSATVMPDHLKDKMLQRNPQGTLQKQHSSTDYNFTGARDSVSGGTPTAYGGPGPQNAQRFANNMTNFQKYKLQKHRESISGARRVGGTRQQSRAQDRPGQQFNEVLPRHNSQAINMQHSINSKQTVSQQFVNTEHYQQLQKLQSQAVVSQSKGLSDKPADAATHQPGGNTKTNEVEATALNYIQTGNSRETGLTSVSKHFNTQQQESSYASTGQTLDTVTGNGAPAASRPGCQWWQNNYMSFRSRKKQDLDPATAEGPRAAGVNLLQIKSNERKEIDATHSGPLSRLPAAHGKAEVERETMSLLTNKTLMVGNHCVANVVQNLMLDKQLGSSDRMIKNQKGATVASTIGYYGLNVDYQQYVKQMGPLEKKDQIQTRQGQYKSLIDAEEKVIQSVKAQNFKLNLDESANQDDSKESATTKRYKLASARHARPPKGISNLCSTSNKGLDSTGAPPPEQAQGPSLQDASKKSSVIGFVSAKKSQGSQPRAREASNDYHSSARRRRLKSTQLSVDINKVRHQQEFLEHRARLAANKQQQMADESARKGTTMSAKKRRQGARPQSSAPAAQMSRRKNRGERIGKRTALVSNQKKLRSSKCNDLLDDLDQVDKDSLLQANEGSSKEFGGQINDTNSIIQNTNSKQYNGIRAPKSTSKQGPDSESKILPALPLPPRTDSSRKQSKQQASESSRNQTGKQIQLSAAQAESKIQSNNTPNLQQSLQNSGINSPDMRRKSTSSQKPTVTHSAVQLIPEPSNDSLQQAQATNGKDLETEELTINEFEVTIQPSKSSPTLVKAASKEEVAPEEKQSEVQLPQISAQSFLIYDCKSGQVLMSRKGTQKREVASITKMMTFYTVLKLIERYHSCLQPYGYDLQKEQQKETTELPKKNSGQVVDANGNTVANLNNVEIPNTQSSTSSTSNSIHILAGQNSAANTKDIGLNRNGYQAASSRVLDQCLSLNVRISRKASKIPGTTANLREGDILMIDQLLYGMMLPSGNDAAYALAEFFGKVLKEKKYDQTLEEEQRATATSSVFTKTSHSPYIRYFLWEMNFYGQKLGLTNTNYDSPHGLCNKNNVSCAADVAKLIRECMIGGPRSKSQRRKDDFTALQELLTDQEPKEATQTYGWVQRVYRRVVGTKRHETMAIVPVEMTAKEIKKELKKEQMKAKKKNDAEGADKEDNGEIEEEADNVEKEAEKEEKDEAPKIKLKTRKYRWENTNKLLNVQIDQNKEDQASQESGQKSLANIDPQSQILQRALGTASITPERKPVYTGGYIIGCKTGITQAAGHCFAGFYENDELGIQLALIVLHSKSSDLRWHEIKQMVRWAHQCDRSTLRRRKARRKLANAQAQEAQREKEVQHAKYRNNCKEMQKNIFGL